MLIHTYPTDYYKWKFSTLRIYETLDQLILCLLCFSNKDLWPELYLCCVENTF